MVVISSFQLQFPLDANDPFSSESRGPTDKQAGSVGVVTLLAGEVH